MNRRLRGVLDDSIGLGPSGAGEEERDAFADELAADNRLRCVHVETLLDRHYEDGLFGE